MTDPTPPPDPTPPAISPPAPTPSLICRRLGIVNPDEDVLQVAEDAIEDAIADVEAYIGQPITPTTKVATGCWPLPWGWDLPDTHERIRSIVSAVPEYLVDQPTILSGTFTVTYTIGLDVANDVELRPIRRYLTASALNNYLLLQYAESKLGMRGPVNSVSVSTEGQSKNVTYGHLGYLPPTSRSAANSMDYPGQLPKLATLDRWRIAGRRVHQAPTAVDPWFRERAGYGGGWYGTEDYGDRVAGGRWWE